MSARTTTPITDQAARRHAASQVPHGGETEEAVIFLHLPKTAGTTVNRLIEWEYLVDHGSEASGLEKLANLAELPTVWTHEQERILDAAFLGVTNHLPAQHPEHKHHEKVHTSGASERGVRWTDE